jgi:hypothetical protein
MALPDRMSLRPGLVWLTENLGPVVLCLSWNIFFACPSLKTTRVELRSYADGWFSCTEQWEAREMKRCTAIGADCEDGIY